MKKILTILVLTVILILGAFGSASMAEEAQVAFYNANGDSVAINKINDEAAIFADLSFESDKECDVNIFVAYYEFGGILQKVEKLTTRSVTKGEVIEYTTPDLDVSGAYTVKVFAWNEYGQPVLKKAGTISKLFSESSSVNVNNNEGTLAQNVVINGNSASADVPEGVALDEGATTLTLSLKSLNESSSGIEADENQKKTAVDIHVEGVSKDNSVPILVTVDSLAEGGLNNGNLSLYHVESNGTKEMTEVSSVDELSEHNQYVYDAENGTVTLALANFSEILVVSDTVNAWNGDVATAFSSGSGTEDDPYIIANADQLAYLGEVISYDSENYGDKYYKLVNNVNIGGSENPHIFYPIGYRKLGVGANKAGEEAWYTYGGTFSGVFDGAGHTISGIYQNTWSMDGNYDNGYYDEAMGLFGHIDGGTVKNLTIDNFSSDGEFTPTGCVVAYAENSTFENIALTNCNPRVYNTGNGGIVGIGGSSDDTEADRLTFSNITIDNTNKITALWGSWDVACGGLVGMFRGAGHVDMTNCHVAAQIDVYNDVCGNYQYYWYRYAGMMVGTNKNMVTDEKGYTVPETDKFHAENCTVHFGEWNDYYYCELVANSLASYTHDHQFSRLTQVDSVDAENKAVTVGGETTPIPDSGRYNYVVVNGAPATENATCYHFVDGEVWNHEDAGKETVNGEEVLKEDKQHYYLPFNQLFTGYGWGVQHIPVYNGEDYAFEGITILDREVADSVVKFTSIAKETYFENTTVTVGELFEAKDNLDVEIDTDNLQVFVTPADETSTVEGTYTPDTTDWTKGTIEFTGLGNATITITDYYFCTPTTIEITVAEPAVATAKILGGILFDTTDTINIEFNTDGVIDAIDDDAVTIEGADTSAVFNSETKILSLTPVKPFIAGKEYTVSFNSEALRKIGIALSKETLTFSVKTHGVNCFINDDFNTTGDLGNWKLVYGQESGKNITLKQTTLEDGSGVMEFSADRYSSEATKASPTISNDFDDIDFANTDEIIIETRFFATGGINRVMVDNDGDKVKETETWPEGSITYLKFNQPEDQTLAGIAPTNNGGGYLGSQGGTLISATASGVGYKITNGYTVGTANPDLTNGEWINAKIVMKPNEGTYGTYSITTWADGDETNAVTKTNGTLQENTPAFYDPQTYVDNGKSADVNADGVEDGVAAVTATKHFELRNLLYIIRQYSNTMYIDYIKGYAKLICEDATATINGGSTVKYDEPIKFTFKAADMAVTSIPDGAVTISGVETTQSFDAETGVLSVIPATPLTIGNSYTVTVNKAVLSEAGIEYIGTTSFTVRARDERSTGYVVNDTFENEADKDNWIIGGANSGYKAVTDIVTVDGDNKALSVKMETITNAASGVNKVPNIIRNIGNGIEFKEDQKIIIRTRAKVKSAKIDADGEASSTSFHLRMNSIGYEKGGAATDQHHIGWVTYSIFHLGESGVACPNGAGYKNGDNGWYYDREVLAGSNNSAILDKWVDYTIIVDGMTNKTTVNAVCDDISLNQTTTNSTAGVSPRALVNEYGEGTTKTHFDAMDTLSFALFNKANTDSELLIDYFKVHVCDSTDGVVYNLNGSTAMYNEPLEFMLDSTMPVLDVSPKAITIDGVETTLSYDAETQIITVTPADDLTIGETYTVTVDKNALARDGITNYKITGIDATYNGTTKFSIRARDVYETGVVIEDNFEAGEDDWAVGKCVSGYEAAIDVVDETGAADGKALKIDFPARVTTANNQYGSVTKQLGNGIEFNSDSKVVIETRVKKASADGHFAIKLNRPDTLTQFENDRHWSQVYSLMENGTSGVSITRGVSAAFSSGGTYWYPGTEILSGTAGFDFADKWVTYKLVLDYSAKTVYTTITYTDDDGNEVTLVDNDSRGKMQAARWDIDAIYGGGAYDVLGQYYKSLDRITFTSTNDCDIYVDYVNVYTENN